MARSGLTAVGPLYVAPHTNGRADSLCGAARPLAVYMRLVVAAAGHRSLQKSEASSVGASSSGASKWSVPPPISMYEEVSRCDSVVQTSLCVQGWIYRVCFMGGNVVLVALRAMVDGPCVGRWAMGCE